MNFGFYFKFSGLLILTILLNNNSKAQDTKLGVPSGHINLVKSAVFSSDDKNLLTASADNTAKLWDVESGKLLITYKGHTDGVTNAVFSNDGNNVLTSSEDGTAIIWNKITGEVIHKLTGHKLWINSISYSHDGKYIVTASHDKTAKVWEAKSGKELFTISGHKNWVQDAVFSPDGNIVVSCSWDSTAQVWDVKKGVHLKTLSNRKGYVNTAAFSPDGNLLITCEGNYINIWNTSNLENIKQIKGHDGSIQSIEFSNDGKQFLTSSLDGKAKIWDAKTGDIKFELTGNGWVNKVRFSPDAKYVALACENLLAKIYDASTGKLLFNLKGHSSVVTDVCYSNDGKKIASVSWDNTAKLWNARNGSLKYNLSGNATLCLPMCFSPDGKEIILAKDGHISYSDVSRGKTIRVLNTNNKWPNYIKFSSDGKVLLTSTLNNIFIWNTANGKLVFQKSRSDESKVDLNPNGNEFVISSQNSIYLFSSDSGKLKYQKEVVENPKYGDYCSNSSSNTFFSPDGKFLISAVNGCENMIAVFDVKSGDKIFSKDFGKGFFNETEDIRLSADSKRLLLTNRDNYVLCYEIANGELKFKIKAHSTDINSIYFSPNGDRFTTASCDKKAKIWNAKDGSLLLTIEGHTDWVTSSSFNKDGSRLITTSSDKTVKVWDVQTGNLIYTISDAIVDHSFPIISPDEKNMVLRRSDSKLSCFDFISGKELFSWQYIDSADIVILHQSGLFDATSGAMEKMYWVKGLEIIDFNQLKERYWEPGLWEKVMKGENLRDVRGMNELKLQPELELAEIKDGKLPISLTKRDGGYGRVVVMINGKEVEADARGNGFDTTKVEQTILYDLKDNPLLEKGKENIITVKTWSADGFVEGRGITVNYKPKGDSITSAPSLFAVVLGISEYSSSAIHLNYAKPDAIAMANAIKIGGENLFGKDKTFIYTLTNPGDIKPTKDNIHKIFTEIKSKAKPGDIFMLYMSGHGITWGGEGGDFYYLTADAYSSSAEAYNDPAIRKNNTISTNEFTEWIKEIPALKQFMIIDACGSGKAVDNLLAKRDVNASQIKSIDRMKDRTGMFIISGCAADAVSYEASRYGQGLLTYTILQAIKGAALREDKFIDVNTILNYSREKVPELAAGVGGIQQPQLLIPKGGSFDIGLMDETAKTKVLLASPKPVFVRTSMQDEESFEDIEQLAKAIDEQLGNLSTRGSDAKIIFLDSRDYPDCCKISGRYSVKNGLFTLNGKVKCGSTETPIKINGLSKEKTVSEIINIVNMMKL